MTTLRRNQVDLHAHTTHAAIGVPSEVGECLLAALAGA